MEKENIDYTAMQKDRPSTANSQKRVKTASLPEPEQNQEIEEYIEILLEHQKNCEKTGKYVEAEMAKRRLQELKKQLEKKNKEETKVKHLTEIQQIETSHMNEFNEFNAFWDNKMKEFEGEANRVHEQMLAKHQEELQQFAEELERQIPLKPKDNVTLLNLKKMEESLARQEEYIEAHKVQQQVLKLEKDEYEKYLYQRNEKIRNLIKQLKQRQQNEVNALQQRIASGQEEQRKIRSQELEKLILKYQNVRKDVESAQNQEMSRMDKSLKQGSVMNASRMMNSSRVTSVQGSKRI